MVRATECARILLCNLSSNGYYMRLLKSKIQKAVGKFPAAFLFITILSYHAKSSGVMPLKLAAGTIAPDLTNS